METKIVVPALSLGPPASPPAPDPSSPSSPNPWHSRGYLPHFDRPLLLQSLTFRLHDAVPEAVVEDWRGELASIQTLQRGAITLEADLRKRLLRYEDAGHGVCRLRDARIASVVENALLHFDGQRYRLIAWCVMPNHVHAMVETQAGWPLASVVQVWKSYTAHRANEVLRRSGDFWARDYYDRVVRNDRHFRTAVEYIEDNPVKAGLVDARSAWRWSSAWRGRANQE